MWEMELLPGTGGATLAPLAVAVLVACAGLAVGLGSIRRGRRWLGVGAILTNLSVALLYGFFVVFFGLGGSR